MKSVSKAKAAKRRAKVARGEPTTAAPRAATSRKAATKAPAAKNSLVANINRRKKAGTSRGKADSTVSEKSYEDMRAGWPRARRKSRS